MVVLTEFVVILAFMSRFWFDKKLNDLREANDSKQVTIQSYVDVEEEMRKILVKQSAIKESLDSNLGVEKNIDKLRLLLPKGTVLNQIVFVPSRVGIAGLAGSEQALAQTINAMKSYEQVKSVEIQKVEFDQKQGGVMFEITSHLGEK